MEIYGRVLFCILHHSGNRSCGPGPGLGAVYGPESCKESDCLFVRFRGSSLEAKKSKLNLKHRKNCETALWAKKCLIERKASLSERLG